jgi:NAD(P)-dependent dehydrogenase (short-subunit alcohol dehydrogenase family)
VEHFFRHEAGRLVSALTGQHLAKEYAKDGIRVNAVAPGAVYTPLHRNTPRT